MQPNVFRARTTRATAPALPSATFPHDLRPDLVPAPAQIRIGGPALLVEAWFGDVLLASRLLQAGEPGRFTIGPARGSDAPVNPGYLPAPLAGPDAFALVAPDGDGFAVSLTPAMRAALRTPLQSLPLVPDAGAVEAPLTLLPDNLVEVACGEMLFAIHPAEPAGPLPRPWLPAGWGEEIWYTLGVGVALLAMLLIVRAVPADERALSLDDLGRNIRMTPARVVPPDIKVPDEPSLASAQPGGGGVSPAKGPIGQAGSRKSTNRDGRRAVVGPPGPKTAQAAADRIRQHSILAVLSDPKAGPLAEVMARTEAIGGDLADAFGHMDGTTIADAYGFGGLHSMGTGEGGGGTNERMIAGAGLGTHGRFGPGGGGTGPGYGKGVGQLAMRHAPKTPDPILGIGTVNGMLDKEIIRRIVRRHLNEVRYCYEQALPRHPTLAGRVVTQFTIGKDGQVVAAVLQSSTLGMASVESCVVGAVKRWPFPAPERGGLTIVSYPFQFTPGGA